MFLDKFKNVFNGKEEIYLRVKAHPNAHRTEVKQVMEDDTIKIDVAAKPEKNKANQEIIKFLAIQFEIPETNVIIVSGKTD